MSTLLSTLWSRFAGESLRGLRGEAAVEKARTLPTDKLLELFRALVALGPEIEVALREARAQEQKGIELLAEEMRDKGQSIAGLGWDATKAPLQLAVCQRYVDQYRDEFGLMDQPGTRAAVSLADIRAAIHGRINILTLELTARYQRAGLPAGAVALKAELAKAKMAAYTALATWREAGKRFTATRLPAMEAEAVEAATARDAADATVTQLVRRLWSEWAITA